MYFINELKKRMLFTKGLMLMMDAKFTGVT
jgi:hypothetical protein